MIEIILNLISKWLKKHNINPMVLVTDEDLKNIIFEIYRNI